MRDAKAYWFPRKRFGWGWGLPCAWQGWVVFAAWLAALVALAFAIPPDVHPAAFLAGVVVAALALLAVCWIKGEPPGGWHWGD